MGECKKKTQKINLVSQQEIHFGIKHNRCLSEKIELNLLGKKLEKAEKSRGKNLKKAAIKKKQKKYVHHSTEAYSGNYKI